MVQLPALRSGLIVHGENQPDQVEREVSGLCRGDRLGAKVNALRHPQPSPG